MMKRTLLMWCLAFLLTPHLCHSQGVTIAAARIEPIGVREETAKLTDELIITALAGETMFTVIERRQVDALMEEQRLQQSGITDTTSAVEAGSILNADKILFGSIGKYDSKYVEFILSFRLVDVERAEVEAADSIQVRSAAELPEKVSELIGRITAGISITGKITGTEDESVYISLGTRSGITAGDTLSVYRTEIIRDEEGTILMREDVSVANLRAEHVQEDGSRCIIIESAESLEKGFFVRPGRTELSEKGDYGSISVDSRPKNARVFLNGDFVGETPLAAASVPAGNYKIEIRAGGYKPYHGTLRLQAGRTVSIDRELEQDIEIEDLILLGKLPRRPVSPSTALKKALIPGQGLVYNGYRNLGLVMPAQIFTLPAVAAYLVFTAPPEAGAEPNPTDPYWDRREYYRNIDQRRRAGIGAAALAGYSLGLYAFSIADSAASADEDFLYPVYLELTFGGCGSFTRKIQSADVYDSAINTEITAGLESFTGGGFFELSYMGRKYHFLLGLDYQVDSIIMRVESAFRLALSESFFIGPGVFIAENFSEPSNIDIGNPEFSPISGGYTGLMLHAAWRPSSLCLDGWFSPYTTGIPYAYAPAGSEAVSDSVAGITGMAGGLKVVYYYNLGAGIRLSADLYDLFNNRSRLADEGFTTIDSDLHINLRAGMVFRF